MRADWVYRGNKFLLGGDVSINEEEAQSGTYYAPFALPVATPGNPYVGATGQVLYDSGNYMGGRYGQDREPATGEPRLYGINPEARPDSPMNGPLIHGCDLHIHIYNSSWVGMSRLYLGLRIIVAEQDPESGQALLHAAYSMWQDVGGLNAQPAVWANGRQNCWEDRITRVFRSSDGEDLSLMYSRRVRFKRRLEANEGLFLYFETHPSGNAVGLINPFCRTLVSDTRA